MINESSTKTFISNSNIIIAKRFLKLQTLYTNGVHDIVKVYDQKVDKESVLKIIKNKENLSLLENEFKVIMSLNDYNIIRGYEIYEVGDLFFYSMEFINGNFEIKNLKYYVHDILRVFEKIHSLNFIHNDIKLNNFIFDGKRVVLIDFSKSKRANNSIEIQNEKLIISRFLIQWTNYNLKIDFLGNPSHVKNYLYEEDVKILLRMFYGK